MSLVPLLARFRPGITDLAVVLFIFYFLNERLDTFASDPGLGWHLKSGELFLSNWALPLYDPFLASAEPVKWVADQWLGSTLLTALFHLGGWPLLYAIGMVVFTATFFLLVGRNAVTLGLSPLATVVGCAFVGKLSSVQFVLRPIIPALFFFALAFVFLEQWQRKLSTHPEHRRFFLTYFLLMVLWTNIHPYFVFGLILPAIYFLAHLTEVFVLRRKQVPLVFWPYIKLGAFAFLGTFLTPYGVELYQAIFHIGGNRFFTNFLSEWRPLLFASGEGALFLIYIEVILLAFFLSERNRQAWRTVDFLLLFLFGSFALTSVRGLPLLGICTAHIFIRAVTDLFTHRWFDRFEPLQPVRNLFSQLSDSESRSTFGRLGLMVSLLLLITVALCGKGLPNYSGDFGPSRAEYPYGAVQYLREKVSQEERIVVANQLNWGGFLTFTLYPWVKPLVDDRLSLRSEDFYRNYLEQFHNGKKWTIFFAQHETDYVLVSRNSSLGKILLLADRFPLVYIDEISLLFQVSPELSP